MSGSVDHHPAVLQFRFILDVGKRYQRVFQKLGEGLHCVDVARVMAAGYGYALLVDW